MKVGKKQLYIILIELGVLVGTFLYLFIDSPAISFVQYSRFGVCILLFYMILFCMAQTKIITIQTLFLTLFILFQFGLPIVYAFDPQHYNFYISLFSEEILKNAAKYTIVATQIYIVVTTIAISNRKSEKKEKKLGKWTKTILNHSKEVEDAALLLFAITAMVAVPVNLWSAVQALTVGGAIGNLYRGAMSANGLTRIFQEFFFSSGLLFLCFSKRKIQKKVVTVLYFIVAISMLVVADRSGGITALVVYALYCYYTGSEKNKKKNAMALIIIGVLLAVVSSAIASIRLGEHNQNGLNYLLSILEEMGFNFTSLCFVMDYIPSKTFYRLGMSYITAVILLIPKTFGLGGVYPKLQSYLGETWLWNANNLHGREFLNFGVGFSLIAESYYNFSWAGVIVMIPIGGLIAHFLKEKKIENEWSLYIRLVLMLSFFTVPRRQFLSVIKAIEYSVFFVAVYLIAYIKIRKKGCMV